MTKYIKESWNKKASGGVNLASMKRNGIKISSAGISKNKYNELKYFCAQYNEKKHQAKEGDVKSAQEAELIEKTAIMADREIYPYILKSVTEKIPYEHMDVPCGRRQFYEARKIFFVLLAEKR